MTGWPARAFHTVEVPWHSLAGMLAWPHERTLPRAFPSDGHDRIRVLEGLLTVRECELLVASGALLMRNTNDGSAHVIKYGPTESSALIQSLDARVAQALGGAADHCERMTLMRHAPGQVNMVIGDGSIGLADPLLRRPATHIAAGVVRVLGEIAPLWFPRLNNLRVNCAQGGAVLWDLRGADGVFDERLTASDEAPQRDFRFSLIKARYDRPVSTGF